jgi:hypothetical protein
LEKQKSGPADIKEEKKVEGAAEKVQELSSTTSIDISDLQ